MDKDKKITVCQFPDEKVVFMGVYTLEPCTCCGRADKDSAYVVKINGSRSDTRLVLCSECLNKLYNEIDQVLHKTVKVDDIVWELVQCNDIWKIHPMTVKSVCMYGSVRQVKGKEPVVWNIYAEGEYTYTYKNFCDVGTTLFFTEEEAKAALKKKSKKHKKAWL